MIDVTRAKVPGMGNLHPAVIKAELECMDEGMRKNAAALEAVSRVIAGEEGAEASA
jgi:hypothetical protein